MVSDDAAAGIGVCVIFVIMVLAFLRMPRNVRKEEQEDDSSRPRSEEEETGGGEDTATGRVLRQLPAAQQASGPPLVCTYRRADGWREGSCGACLSELADGEVVRVLPACMHYFHAACVHEWLLAHATCPLCRAPLAAAA